MSGQRSRGGAGGSSADRISITKTRLIVGEGRDEEMFFRAMLKHLGREDVQVLSSGGKAALFQFLGLLMNDPMWPDVQSLLVLRDADFALERSVEPAARSAWRSVTDALRERGLPVPLEHGQITSRDPGVTVGPPRIGVFILPDGISDGMLEDLCLEAAVDDPVRPCLDTYLRCIEEKRGAIPVHLLPKARAHAYLASRPTPDKRVGEAAMNGYWPWDAPAFAPLLAFVAGA